MCSSPPPLSAITGLGINLVRKAIFLLDEAEFFEVHRTDRLAQLLKSIPLRNSKGPATGGVEGVGEVFLFIFISVCDTLSNFEAVFPACHHVHLID
jgi:hypothetical protein